MRKRKSLCGHEFNAGYILFFRLHFIYYDEIEQNHISIKKFPFTFKYMKNLNE